MPWLVSSSEAFSVTMPVSFCLMWARGLTIEGIWILNGLLYLLRWEWLFIAGQRLDLLTRVILILLVVLLRRSLLWIISI